MNAAHLGEAQVLLSKLHTIAAERKAINGGLSSAGVRCANAASTWVNAYDDTARTEVKRAILNSLDRAEAALRRRAAQISLTL